MLFKMKLYKILLKSIKKYFFCYNHIKKDFDEKCDAYESKIKQNNCNIKKISDRKKVVN